MGLDQHAYFLKESQIKIDGGGALDWNDDDIKDSFYWRKHPNLQGWMANLYYEKGGKDEFNCIAVELDLDDLERLEAAIKNTSNSVKYITNDKSKYAGEKLPETEGFFFGGNSDEEYKEQDLQFVNAAMEAILDGKRVFYQPSY